MLLSVPRVPDEGLEVTTSYVIVFLASFRTQPLRRSCLTAGMQGSRRQYLAVPVRLKNLGEPAAKCAMLKGAVHYFCYIRGQRPRTLCYSKPVR